MNTEQTVQRYKMDKEDKDAKGTTEIKRGCRQCCNTKDREDTRGRRMAKGQTNNRDKKGQGERRWNEVKEIKKQELF